MSTSSANVGVLGLQALERLGNPAAVERGRQSTRSWLYGFHQEPFRASRLACIMHSVEGRLELIVLPTPASPRARGAMTSTEIGWHLRRGDARSVALP